MTRISLQTNRKTCRTQATGWRFVKMPRFVTMPLVTLGGMAVAALTPAQAQTPRPPQAPQLQTPQLQAPQSLADTKVLLHPCPGIYYEEPHNQLHIVPQGCPPNAATRHARAGTGRFAPAEDVSGLFESRPLPVLEGALVLPVLEPNAAFSNVDLEPGVGVEPEPRYDGIGGAYGSLPENLAVEQTRPRAVGTGPLPVARDATRRGFSIARSRLPATRLNPRSDGALPLPEVQQVAVARVQPESSGAMSLQLTNNTATEIEYQIITHSPLRQLLPGETVLLKDLPTPVTVTMVRPDGGFLQLTPTENREGLLALDLDASGRFSQIQGALTIQADGQVFLD